MLDRRYGYRRAERLKPRVQRVLQVCGEHKAKVRYGTPTKISMPQTNLASGVEAYLPESEVRTTEPRMI
jgi:hypothetical protein